VSRHLAEPRRPTCSSAASCREPCSRSKISRSVDRCSTGAADIPRSPGVAAAVPGDAAPEHGSWPLSDDVRRILQGRPCGFRRRRRCRAQPARGDWLRVLARPRRRLRQPRRRDRRPLYLVESFSFQGATPKAGAALSAPSTTRYTSLSCARGIGAPRRVGRGARSATTVCGLTVPMVLAKLAGADHEMAALARRRHRAWREAVAAGASPRAQRSLRRGREEARAVLAASDVPDEPDSSA
jgi:hypothetical protein